MYPQAPQYFVIIVHYQDIEATQRLVQTLANGTRPPDRLLVIDHGDEAITAQLIGAEVLRPQENSGYAGGINVGLGVLFAGKPKETDIVVCLNNDVTVQTTTLQQLATWVEQQAAPGVWGAELREVNFWTGRTYPRTKAASTKSVATYVHGAFFVAPWQVFMVTQGVPDTYFLYWEDVAFSQKARQAGYALQQLPNLGISHDDVSRPQTDQQLYYLVRNGALYLEKKTSWPLRSWWWLVNRLRYGYHTVRQTPVVQEALSDAVVGQEGRRTG